MQRRLYNVWRTTSELWDSVTEKRIDLQELRLKLKLYSVLKEQVMSLSHYHIRAGQQYWVSAYSIVMFQFWEVHWGCRHLICMAAQVGGRNGI